MAFFEERIEKGVIVKLQAIVDTPFVRMDYTDAINILSSAKAKFEFPVTWGMDLQSEHERYLAEQHVRGPLVRLTEERVGPRSVAFFLSGALTGFSAAIPFQLA